MNKRHESVAIGISKPVCNDWGDWQGFSIESLNMLINWADLVIDLSDTGLTNRFPVFNIPKIKREYIGKDIWIDPRHPELEEKLKEVIARLQL
jgi:hypothetical protein